MKKIWKRLVCLALLLTLCLSAGTTLSDGTDTLTVAIGDKNSEFNQQDKKITLELYRIGYDLGDNKWVLDDAFSQIDVVGADKAGKIDAAIAAIWKVIEAQKMQPTATGTTDASGKCVFKDLPRGYYIGRMTSGPDWLTVQDFLTTVPQVSQNGAYMLNATANLKHDYVTPTPTPSPTPTATPTPSPTPTTFTTPSPTPSPTPTATPTESPAPTPTPTPTPTPRTTQPSGGGNPTPTPTPSPTPTPTPSSTPTATITPLTTPGPTVSAKPTVTPEPTPRPTPGPHNLHIEYVDVNDEPVYDDYRGVYMEGEDYKIVSPVIPGYYTFIEVVEGTMPNHDVEVKVIYYKKDSKRKYINIDDYETALGIGMIQMHVGVCYE